jgi:hypothetical protein
MNDEELEVQAEEPAEPAELAEETAAAEPEELPEEGQEDESRPKGKTPKWAEKRFAELTRQREEERRRAERLESMLHEVYTKQQPAPQAAPPAEQPPKQEDFADYDEFLRAAARYEVRQELQAERAQEEAKRKQHEAQTYHQQQQARIVTTIQKAQAAHDDFNVVVTDSLPVSEIMLNALAESDHGPDILYYLGKNPQESARIAGLSPFGQVRELGRIEAKIATPKPISTTNAPAPIKPVGSRGPVVTDWVNDETISASEWIKRRNKQLYG